MKTFKKVLASALAAAMVVTAFPVTNAEAATAPKLSTTKATLYVGQSKTITVKNLTSKWKGAKVVSATSKKSVATVSRKGNKITVKAVKAGKATVTVKVTPKKGKAKSLKATITVKNPTLTVKAAATELAVGETTTITAKATPKKTVSFKSSDETIATVDATGTVKAVKVGKVTITATAGKVSKDIEIEVKNYILKSVKQNKTNELIAIVDGSTKKIKTSDVTIKTPDNVVLPVKSLTVDSKDATKLTLVTFSEMKDAKEYTVTLDGTTVKFVATDNKVASINIDKATIPVKTETEIKLVAKDANGVILKELPYGTPDVNYDFSLTTANGYVNGSKLYLNKVGDTATAEITYKTNKFTADGKPDGNIGPNKLTITATEQAAISSFKVRIGDANKKFGTLKDNDKVAIDETRDVYAYFEIKDVDGKEISNYGEYTLESSDKTTLMLMGDTMGVNHRIQIVPAKEGTAYIFIKKDDKIVASVPVTVVAARKVTTMSADKSALVVSKAIGANSETVVFTTKDQYGNDFDYTTGLNGSIAVACAGAPEGVDKALVTLPDQLDSGVKTTYKFVGSDYVKGTYTFKFTFVKDGKEVCAQVVTVNVQEAGVAGDSISYSLNINNSNSAAQTEEDAVVNADHTTDRSFTISVSELLKGVEAKKLAKNNYLDDVTTAESETKTASKVQGIYYTVKDAAGKVKYNNVPGTTVVTGTAFDSGNNRTPDQLVVDIVKKSDSHYAQLPAGTYTVTTTIVVEPKHVTIGYVSNPDKFTKTTITKTFVVKDSSNDAITDMKLKDARVVSGSSIQASLASTIQYSYDGVKYGADGDQAANIVSVEGYSNGVSATNSKVDVANMNTVLVSGKTVNITKVVVRVYFHNAAGDVLGTVDREVNVALSFTTK